MNPAKQVLYELTEELREIMGGSENDGSDNPIDVIFGTHRTQIHNQTEAQMTLIKKMKKQKGKQKWKSYTLKRSMNRIFIKDCTSPRYSTLKA